MRQLACGHTSVGALLTSVQRPNHAEVFGEDNMVASTGGPENHREAQDDDGEKYVRKRPGSGCRACDAVGLAEHFSGTGGARGAYSLVWTWPIRSSAEISACGAAAGDDRGTL